MSDVYSTSDNVTKFPDGGETEYTVKLTPDEDMVERLNQGKLL